MKDCGLGEDASRAGGTSAVCRAALGVPEPGAKGGCTGKSIDAGGKTRGDDTMRMATGEDARGSKWTPTLRGDGAKDLT